MISRLEPPVPPSRGAGGSRVLAGILTGMLLLAGCGSDPGSPDRPDSDPGSDHTTSPTNTPADTPTSEPSGTPSDGGLGVLVASWSEAEYAALGEVDPPLTSRLLATDAERAAYLAMLPTAIDTRAAEAVDLAESVIVAGAYGRCVEQGRVLAAPLRFEVYVDPEDEGTSCVWAPLQVEIWEVPREDVGTVPDELAEAP